MKIFLDQDYNDQFLSGQKISGSFLQSSHWQKFLVAQGKNVWRLSFKEGDKTLGTCLLYENKLLLGRSYLTAPKGPIFYEDLALEKKTKLSQLFFSSLRDLTITTKNKQEIFIRLESPIDLGIKELKKSLDIHPKETWLTDLSMPLVEMLRASHPKTRYNISLAEKKGVKVEFFTTSEKIKIFTELLRKTAQRQAIGTHSEGYFKLWAETFFSSGFSELAVVSLNGQALAANLMVRFGDMVSYVHGASDYSQRAIMAPHYLHWTCLKHYKEQGYKTYDWWGISPTDGSKPTWQGISRFKQGFVGSRQVSPGTQDFVYDESWYQAYQLLRKIWRKLR